MPHEIVYSPSSFHFQSIVYLWIDCFFLFFFLTQILRFVRSERFRTRPKNWTEIGLGPEKSSENLFIHSQKII